MSAKNWPGSWKRKKSHLKYTWYHSMLTGAIDHSYRRCNIVQCEKPGKHELLVDVRSNMLQAKCVVIIL
jgi:hypothetical protein